MRFLDWLYWRPPLWLAFWLGYYLAIATAFAFIVDALD